jgi:hypothetical protein
VVNALNASQPVSHNSLRYPALRRRRVELVGGRAEQLFLRADELLLGHAALLNLGLLLLAVLLRVSPVTFLLLLGGGARTCCCFL